MAGLNEAKAPRMGAALAQREERNLRNALRLRAAVFAYLSGHDWRAALMADCGGHAARVREEVAMIVMAGSFRRYGVPARLGESAGKVRAARQVRYVIMDSPDPGISTGRSRTTYTTGWRGGGN